MDEAKTVQKQSSQNVEMEADGAKPSSSLVNMDGVQDSIMEEVRENPESTAVQNQQSAQFLIDDSMLARKLGQIIGFHFELEDFSEVNAEQNRPVFSPQLLISFLKENDMDAQVVQEAEQAIEKSKLVKDKQGQRDFFKRDVSLIQDNRGARTIYAVDVDNAPEMNLVEKVFRSRDMLLEKGQLSIILPEEELKKHQKDPKMDMIRPDPDPHPPKPDKPDPILPHNKYPYPVPKPEPRIVVPPDSLNQEQRYCVCAKKNDNQQYVQCEDECEWYHPECVGFKQDLFDIKQVKFLCPFCKADTRKKILQLEQQGLYKKINSMTKKEYFAFIPENCFQALKI